MIVVTTDRLLVFSLTYFPLYNSTQPYCPIIGNFSVVVAHVTKVETWKRVVPRYELYSFLQKLHGDLGPSSGSCLL
jgi:hypothetical protein